MRCLMLQYDPVAEVALSPMVIAISIKLSRISFVSSEKKYLATTQEQWALLTATILSVLIRGAWCLGTPVSV
jgi:hypothetical protein